MPDIVLTTINAKFIHAAFGLRYLRANLGSLRDRSVILEFDLQQRTVDQLERILAENPKIVGVGVYIWNAVQSLQLVSELKRVRPDITVIVGGPEEAVTRVRPVLAAMGKSLIHTGRVGSGHAMKAPANPAPGTIVGKALQPHLSGSGTVEMLVMLR